MKTVRANENNDLKFRSAFEQAGNNIKHSGVKYKKDVNGNLILDEKGDPIIESSNQLQYFTE